MTRAASLMSRRRNVSNCATRHIERLGSEMRRPHMIQGACVEEQPQLVGRGLGAGGAIRRQMRLPGFDVIFGLSAPAVEILIERARIAPLEVGDDEACIWSVRPSLDAGADALDATPARGAVETLRDTADFA